MSVSARLRDGERDVCPGHRRAHRDRSASTKRDELASTSSGLWRALRPTDRGCKAGRVLVVRGTKKLRDRVKGPGRRMEHASTTVLGDWFATALFWRPQVALLVNQRTFVPVFMPLAPAATLLDRAPGAIAAVLRRLGADDAFVDAELDAMREARIAPTNDRSVVGVMNEFAFHGEVRSHSTPARWRTSPSTWPACRSARSATAPASPTASSPQSSGSSHDRAQAGIG